MKNKHSIYYYIIADIDV